MIVIFNSIGGIENLRKPSKTDRIVARVSIIKALEKRVLYEMHQKPLKFFSGFPPGKSRWAEPTFPSCLPSFDGQKQPFFASSLNTAKSHFDYSAAAAAKMLKRILKGKTQKAPSALPSIEKLSETLEMLEKKEHLLQKKIAAEIQKAKDFTKAKNKKAAIQCLKKKKLYETQVEQLGNFQLRVHDQMIMLEGVKATTETVDALRTGASAMKSIQMSLNVDDIDKTMDEVNEHRENMKQIQEALATPVGAAADFDEDELEAELEELEEAELEEQLLQPPEREPSISTTQTSLPKKEKVQTNSDVDELAALQAEMTF
ncbi:hypothetical protein ACLOJK_012337 [Asimina triloba]